jgi:hypothetical protein
MPLFILRRDCFGVVQDEDGLHDRGGAAWIAAQLGQDLPDLRSL